MGPPCERRRSPRCSASLSKQHNEAESAAGCSEAMAAAGNLRVRSNASKEKRRGAALSVSGFTPETALRSGERDARQPDEDPSKLNVLCACSNVLKHALWKRRRFLHQCFKQSKKRCFSVLCDRTIHRQTNAAGPRITYVIDEPDNL